MTSDREEDESSDGIRVDLPFGSFRIGRGGRGWRFGMNESDAYARARRRVRARLGFFRNVATFAAVTAAIVFIDLVTGGGLSNFVLWVAGIWGAILVWQGFNVFVFPSVWSRETEERMIQEEMRRHGDE